MVEKPFVLVRRRKAFFIGEVGLRCLLISILLHAVILVDFSVSDTGALPGGAELTMIQARLAGVPPDSARASPAVRVAPVSEVAQPKRGSAGSDKSFANSGQNFQLTAQVPQGAIQPLDANISNAEPIIDQAVVREYRLRLARLARGSGGDPPKTAVGGMVVLKIRKVTGKNLPEVLLDQGSGQSVLDTYATDVVAKAVKDGELPASLSERAFDIYLSMHFDAEN